MALDKAKATELARQVAGYVPDVVRLFRDVARDDRVPRRVKVEAGLAAAYLVMPIDIIPDFLPVIGQLDDLAIAAWAVRRLLLGAGESVLREHWRGTDRGLELLLQAAASGLRPKRLLFAAAFTGGARARQRPPVRDDVIEGEVIAEWPTRKPGRDGD